MKRLALALLLAGCASKLVFPEPDATWQTSSGQLRYTTATQSLIGEFVVSQRAGHFRLDFSKGGAVPLLRIARNGEHGRAEGALARGQWSGPVEKAPAPLRAWLIDVPEMLAHPAARVDLPGSQPGEKFVFIFNH